MESILEKTIQVTQKSELAFSKFITPNDTGTTGSHQAGFYLQKETWPLFFNSKGIKGGNKDKYVTIKWQDDFETSSRFIYYGKGTRNEYRLTRFGRGFPFLNDDNVGDLFVLCKISEDYYQAFVLQKDNDIDDFFSALNISSESNNGLIQKDVQFSNEDLLLKCFDNYIKKLKFDFPNTFEIAQKAREFYNSINKIDNKTISNNPDKIILDWLETEFKLFKKIENNRYSKILQSPFDSIDSFITKANSILQRRKSRAGKSLEHHLTEIFNFYNLNFTTQSKTEGNKKPDFLFPGNEAYHDYSYESNKLVMLAAKTTCKDRWRQILNEADRIKTKHLFTLQQSISKNQLTEMYKSNVCLVVPLKYHRNFPIEFRDKILTLEIFINHVKFNRFN